MLKNFILTGLGGAIGSMLRYALSYAINIRNFPYATLLINITGSLVIGIITGLYAKDESLSNSYKLFLSVGVCGGFTTFSAFAIENVHFFQTGKTMIGLLYISLSILLGIGAAWCGFKLIN